MKAVREIAAYADMQLNVHIMATNPMQYVEPLFGLPSVSEIAVHIEALPYPLAVLRGIRAAGKKAGLALNFSTPVSNLAPFINDLDFILIMSSEPDGADQSFHISAPDRIREARRLLGQRGRVWADGGIVDEQTLLLACKSGADTVVMGRAIVGYDEPMQKIAFFRQILAENRL